MRAHLAILLVGLLAVVSAANEKKVVCYFGSWAVYRKGNGNFPISQIKANLCTHLIYTFIGLNPDGTVNILDSWGDLPSGNNGFGLFNALRKDNPDLKTLIAMGGWNECESPKSCATYSNVVANPELRAKLVKSIVQFVEEYGFDGFDLDWEYPGQRGGASADKENLVLLLEELRQEFDSRGWLLTAAVAASKGSASQSYNIARMAEYLDFINLMEYDFHSSTEPTTGHNAPLYSGSYESSKDLSVDASVQYWIEQGAPAEKLVMGIPAYGKGFTLADPSNNGVNARAAGVSAQGPYTLQAGMLGYNEICEKIVNEKWTEEFDEVQRVPYVHGGNQWFSYDNEQSIAEKGDYVKKNNLGGLMIWSIETDDFLGTCGDGEFPILRAMNRAVGRDAGSSQSSVSKPRPVATTKSAAKATPRKGAVRTTSKPSTTVSRHGYASLKEQPEYVCETVGWTRHPTKCEVFYYCQETADGFYATPMRCPDTLVYNTKYSACDYRANVNC